MIRYLFDECFSPRLAEELQRHAPELEVEYVGPEGVLPKKTPDADVLLWCEANDYVLVTNNRNTMPGHLGEHVAAGRSVPGVFQVPEDCPLGDMFAELILIAGTALPGEYADHVRYLPISH